MLYQGSSYRGLIIPCLPNHKEEDKRGEAKEGVLSPSIVITQRESKRTRWQVVEIEQ